MAKKRKRKKTVETIRHNQASRKNIPTAEYQSVMRKEEQKTLRIAYERRNQDLDPQLVWRGKDLVDWSDLVVPVAPLYIQEKIHPKVLIDDLMRRTKEQEEAGQFQQIDLFADFNGLPDEAAKTEFYQHEANWTNRMILGDSLQVMASLAEREGLRGKVQMIYLDPPYGIKFNSNFQWSTTSRDVKDGKADHITREPEQVKAFRDTWRDGIHSYLSYLRDRLTVARDLLTESGSVFVQIGDENVHRVRALMDEVYGEENFVSQIVFKKASSSTANYLAMTSDYILWYAKSAQQMKYRQLFRAKDFATGEGSKTYKSVRMIDGSIRPLTRSELAERRISKDAKLMRADPLISQSGGENSRFPISVNGQTYLLKRDFWKTNQQGMVRLGKAGRLLGLKTVARYVRYIDDFAAYEITHSWNDVLGSMNKRYVVETNPRVIERCIVMSTDPGDLVLDPTCGSGTTAYVAEQWGRRWITIDTSRVALALARARIMGARYPYYLLADSREGQLKEAEVTRTAPLDAPTYGRIRQGFVYERVPHITLKSIANNAEIDVIWEQYQEKLELLRKKLNGTLSESWEEWEIPRKVDETWPTEAQEAHAEWWKLHVERQKEIDASIAAKADYEYLYDKPYEDKKKVRVAGPFTVESLSPHRVLGVDENDELIDPLEAPNIEAEDEAGFVEMILENLKTAGVQQAHKEDKIVFTSLAPWPGRYICAEGRYMEGNEETGISKRAAIFIGPEFGTVSRPDLVAAAREAGDADFDVLIASAFSYDAHSSEFSNLGRIPVLKARMNADLHMAEDLKKTAKGNLFVIFGEPDISVASEEWIVDSSNRRIAPYELFKLVSRTESLAEVNRLGSQDLRGYAALSLNREVWDYFADAARIDLNSGEHRRRSGETNDGGVSAIAWHCARLSGGIGDLPKFVRKARVSEQRDFAELVERLYRDKQNAERANEISIHSPLTTRHFCQITVNGVDVFHPNTGEVRSDGAEGIACWFIDTDYNEESFFVRHAYFLGANDPYKSLKTTLKAEINEEAWETLHSDTSRPFDKPESGRIAVKVINHLGDEVMKVCKV